MIADLNYLKTMSGGDSKFIQEMIELFREQIDEYKTVMPDLLRDGRYDDLSKVAHKAKSSVAVMGMTEVAELLKELEILAHGGTNVERYGPMIDEFLEQSQLALKELQGIY
jgi:HPt (histidine-containing phosphotransfer) domain-containing protein